MANIQIVDVIKEYLSRLPDYGIHADFAVLFGSFARGDQNELSDIDLVVVAREFDTNKHIQLAKNLWRARINVDPRIEPVPCGLHEWECGDTGRPVIEMAREEGTVIPASLTVMS